MRLPKVSFVLPALNEEKRLTRCLESIKTQDYPKSLVEIVIADGGSKDKTAKIAKNFKAKVIYNPLKLAEPGIYLAVCQATGDICIAVAADNVLPHKNWLNLMVKPFMEDKKIIAAFTRIIPGKDDTLFSQYFALLSADPFNEFVYAKAANPTKYDNLYPIYKRHADFVVYQFNLDNFPLLAIAQGFAFRKTWKRKKEDQYDDMLPIINLIKSGAKIAYVPKAGIYHYSFYGFFDFLRKYNRRIDNALKYGFAKRVKYLSLKRKLRQYLFVPYGLLFIFPLLVGLYKMGKERRIAYIYHPFACFSLSFMILWKKFLS